MKLETLNEDLKKKHIDTLDRIKKVDNNIKWNDVVSLVTRLGATIEQGSGSRVKVTFPNTVWSVHLEGSGKKLKFGIIRELKGVLEKEGLL
jgi:hypothetical protein